MQGPFDLLDHVSDAVKGDARPPSSEVASMDAKWLAPSRANCRRKAAPQGLVQDLLEGPSRSSGDALELCRHVVVERNRRPHIMMLG